MTEKKKKIESLTPKQESQMAVYSKKWIDIGLSTEPMNFEKAKEALTLAYEIAGLKAPKTFYSVESPLSAAKLIKKLDPKISNSDLFKAVTHIYGNHDASWLSFYEYFKDVVGIKEVEKLNGLIEYAKNAGWASVFEDFAVIQDRPERILMDEQNRLHCENGPAIRYRDGFSVYSWHGVRIPAAWIEHKADLTPKVALTWENIEQRRVACEIVGWNRILKELNAVIIDADDDPEIGTLVEVDIPDIGKERFIKVICGTGREFAIPVPPDTETALAGNAWSFGISPDLLKELEIRT